MTTRKATKRGSGEGSWKHLENGKWKVTVTVGVDMNGKQKRRSKTGTKKECQEWFKSYQEVNCDDYFEEYAIKWLNIRKHSISPSTYVTLLRRIKRIGKIRQFKICNATDKIISQITTELLKTQKSQTVNLSIYMIRQVLQYAFHNGHLKVLPYIPNVKSEPVVININVIPTLEEVKKILLLAKLYNINQIYPILLLGFTTGMRIGEILALNLDDIDLDKQTITINKTVFTDIDNLSKIKLGAKTKASNRIIYVNKLVLDEVLKYRQVSAGEYVFCSRNQKIQHRTTVSHRIAYFLKKCGYNFTMHKTRHIFVTLAQKYGVDFLFVSAYVGHSGINETFNTYTHLDIDKPNKKLDEFVRLIMD